MVTIVPIVGEDDIDAVLAIVGTASLLLLPMQIWSKTLENSRGKLILVLWGILLLVGTSSALVTDIYIWLGIFPQLRCCPMKNADQLPMMNDGNQDFKP
jgi:hypothetical protein